MRVAAQVAGEQPEGDVGGILPGCAYPAWCSRQQPPTDCVQRGACAMGIVQERRPHGPPARVERRPVAAAEIPTPPLLPQNPICP